MDSEIHYSISLPEKVDNILSAEVWMLEHLNKAMLTSSSDPIKFSAYTSVFVRKGEADADINLITYKIKAPCLVNIRKGQILQMKFVSDDFDAVFTVLSKRVTENLFLLLKDCRLYSTACRLQFVTIPQNLVKDFEVNVELIKNISADTSNPYNFQAQVLTLAGFFYHTGWKCYAPFGDNFPKLNNRISDQFINLVQQHFKKERFLDFYASKLEITPKHLSRTMKSLTGITAVEWIERYVILEAKVLLKSTNMTVQQIADELNFPSQSFFGKYFKKNVGMSPKDFRNN